MYCSLIRIVQIVPDTKNISKYNTMVFLGLTTLFGADSFWEVKMYVKCNSYMLIGLYIVRRVFAIQ